MKRFAVLLTLLAACSSEVEEQPPAAGLLYYRRSGCTGCHGDGGAGGMLGPPLRELGQNWTREELAGYIAEPLPFHERKPHLEALGERWSADMPSSPHLTEPERLDLADYLLSLRSSD